jgi:hypothetical protein
MRWGRRTRWSLVALLIGLGSATVAMAASLTVASKHLTERHTCVLTGSLGASTSDADTYVQQENGTTNYGTATTMLVQSRSSSKNDRVYVRFDLTKCSPAIPSTAAVKLANLSLYVSTLPGACRTYYVFPTATWAETGITWNNQPFGTTENNPSSGWTASATVGPSPCVVQVAGYVTWAVTSDVQKFVAGTGTNYGWMIRDSAEGASSTARTATFATKEAAVLAHSPQLVVNYR